MSSKKTAKRARVKRRPNALTDKQQRFVAEYLVDFNGMRAAKAAGYACPKVAASKLLNPSLHPEVAKSVAAGRERANRKCELTREMVIEALVHCLTRDVADMVDDQGQVIVDLRKLPAGLRTAIDGVKITEDLDPETGESRGRRIEYKLVGKEGVITLAMKHLGMLTEKTEIKHSLDWDQLLESATGHGAEQDPIEQAIRNGGQP